MLDDPARAPHPAALTAGEADRRKALLARLQDELAACGVRSVLAGRQILRLRGGRHAQPPLPGDPQLHVLGTGHCQVITTDGRNYQLPRCRHPAGDPGGAARCILLADQDHEDAASRVPGDEDGQTGGRVRVIGAGERALRRLLEDGVI